VIIRHFLPLTHHVAEAPFVIVQPRLGAQARLGLLRRLARHRLALLLLALARRLVGLPRSLARRIAGLPRRRARRIAGLPRRRARRLVGGPRDPLIPRPGPRRLARHRLSSTS